MGSKNCYKKNFDEAIAAMEKYAKEMLDKDKCDMIHVYSEDGTIELFSKEEDEWDNYFYDGTVFAVIRHGEFVGIYNIDYLKKVIMT